MGTQVELGLQNVHLVSGEDVIGKVFFDEPALMYTIERPVMPNIQMNQEGRLSVSLLPVRPYLEKTEKIEVLAAHVLYLAPVSERMAQVYQSLTSAIQVAQPEDLKTILQS